MATYSIHESMLLESPGLQERDTSGTLTYVFSLFVSPHVHMRVRTHKHIHTFIERLLAAMHYGFLHTLAHLALLTGTLLRHALYYHCYYY